MNTLYSPGQGAVPAHFSPEARTGSDAARWGRSSPRSATADSRERARGGPRSTCGHARGAGQPFGSYRATPGAAAALAPAMLTTSLLLERAHDDSLACAARSLPGGASDSSVAQVAAAGGALGAGMAALDELLVVCAQEPAGGHGLRCSRGYAAPLGSSRPRRGEREIERVAEDSRPRRLPSPVPHCDRASAILLRSHEAEPGRSSATGGPQTAGRRAGSDRRGTDRSTKPPLRAPRAAARRRNPRAEVAAPRALRAVSRSCCDTHARSRRRARVAPESPLPPRRSRRSAFLSTAARRRGMWQTGSASSGTTPPTRPPGRRGPLPGEGPGREQTVAERRTQLGCRRASAKSAPPTVPGVLHGGSLAPRSEGGTGEPPLPRTCDYDNARPGLVGRRTGARMDLPHRLSPHSPDQPPGGPHTRLRHRRLRTLHRPRPTWRTMLRLIPLRSRRDRPGWGNRARLGADPRVA